MDPAVSIIPPACPVATRLQIRSFAAVSVDRLLPPCSALSAPLVELSQSYPSRFDMCDFRLRVFTCGHYQKTLTRPCDEAKEKREVCQSGNEVSATTGMYCDEEKCDKKAGGFREGPGNHSVSCA